MGGPQASVGSAAAAAWAQHHNTALLPCRAPALPGPPASLAPPRPPRPPLGPALGLRGAALAAAVLCGGHSIQHAAHHAIHQRIPAQHAAQVGAVVGRDREARAGQVALGQAHHLAVVVVQAGKHLGGRRVVGAGRGRTQGRWEAEVRCCDGPRQAALRSCGSGRSFQQGPRAAHAPGAAPPTAAAWPQRAQ